MKRLVGLVLASLLVPVLMVAALGGAMAAQPTINCGAAPGGAPSGPALATRVALAAGFTGQDLVVAVAVAGAESSYRAEARNSIGASGLWQILESAHPDLFARYNWRDPEQNAVMAHSVWTAAGRSWKPWTAWTSGAYLARLDEARAAAQSILSGDSSTCTADGPTSAAIPFTGPDGYVDDPTSDGRITPRMLHTYNEVQRVFGGWRWGVGCWDPHLWNPTSDHPKGRACDFTVGTLGAFPNPAERAAGWQLAHWLQPNSESLGIEYIIWDGHIWSPLRAEQGWRPYGGAGIYDPTSPTGGHFDHIHVSVKSTISFMGGVTTPLAHAAIQHSPRSAFPCKRLLTPQQRLTDAISGTGRRVRHRGVKGAADVALVE